MTDNDCKLLTEWMGEDATPVWNNSLQRSTPGDRTFTTWDDFGALVARLRETGKWRDFWDYTAQVCDRMLRPHEHTLWLLDPARFAGLVVEWLRKGSHA